MNKENGRLLSEVKAAHQTAKANEQHLFQTIQTRDGDLQSLRKELAQAQRDRLVGADAAAQAEIKRLKEEMELMRRVAESDKVLLFIFCFERSYEIAHLPLVVCVLE